MSKQANINFSKFVKNIKLYFCLSLTCRLPGDLLRKAADVVQARTLGGTDKSSPAVWAAVKALSGMDNFFES
jgi:hypothetical protein